MVRHWLGPEKVRAKYVDTGRLYCGIVDHGNGKTAWPAHELKYTTCKRCLAKAKRESPEG